CPRRHDRRESRDRTGSKVVSVRKAARNHDRVERRQCLGLMPDEFRGRAQHLGYRIMTVLVAVGAREDENTDADGGIIHFLALFYFTLGFRSDSLRSRGSQASALPWSSGQPLPWVGRWSPIPTLSAFLPERP